MDPILFGGVGLGVVAVVALIAGLRSVLVAPRDEILDRVERVTRVTASEAIVRPRRDDKRSLWAAMLQPLSKLSKPQGEELSRFRQRLVHAGYRGERAVEVFFGAKIALGLLLALVPFLIGMLRGAPLPSGRLLAIVFGAVGFYAPNIWLRSAVAKRQLAVTRALPDTLDLLVTCVEAGLGLEAAIARIAGEIGLSSPILASELRLTINEINAGVVRADAFRRLADRTGLEELRSLSAMLIQTELFGTSIARALRVHSNSLRVRRTHRAEERGATVSVKMMLPLILCILPALFCVILGPAAVRIMTILMPAMRGGQ
jgi:tight adherence protein C